mgnify:CR=1 FL=1
MTSQLNAHFENFPPPSPPAPRAARNAGLAATRLALQLYARVSPEKAGRMVHHMALKPSRLPMPSRYEYLLDTADSHTQLHHGSNTLPVYSWGEGPVVLGVHGWAGAGIQYGAWVEPLVQAGYRVVLFDAPAHGRAQGDSTNLFEMADVTAKVANSVGRVHGVVAHSMGCLAVARAIADGLQVSYLAMLAPPVSLAAVMDNLGRQLGLTPSVLAVHLQLMEERFGKTLWDRLDLQTLSPSLTHRGLIVIDNDDGSVSPEDSERVANSWEQAAVLRTEGLGHHRLLWSPMVIETVLRDLGRPVHTV